MKLFDNRNLGMSEEDCSECEVEPVPDWLIDFSDEDVPLAYDDGPFYLCKDCLKKALEMLE